MSGINKKYKYWELWHDPESLNGNPEGDQCISTHWSDEWHTVNNMLNKTDAEIMEMIRDDIEFVREAYGEKVTSRSAGPALKEYKEILKEHGFKEK